MIMTPEKNLNLMKTLDDSWNSQDLTVFRQRHAKDCIVRWPNQPPTNGIEARLVIGILLSRVRFRKPSICLNGETPRSSDSRRVRRAVPSHVGCL
jgi:hypothetical protein